MDLKLLRNTFGRFLTGVVVVITQKEDNTPVGFTANSFSSVSLDPPLVSVCPGQFLSSYEVFKTCKSFTISILSEHQQAVAATFSSFKGDRFSHAHWQPGPETGTPIISDAAASFECSNYQVVPAGDHIILLGEVLSFQDNAKVGLGCLAGEFITVSHAEKSLKNS